MQYVPGKLVSAVVMLIVICVCVCVSVWTACCSVALSTQIIWLSWIKRVQWVPRRTTWLMPKLLSTYRPCSGNYQIFITMFDHILFMEQSLIFKHCFNRETIVCIWGCTGKPCLFCQCYFESLVITCLSHPHLLPPFKTIFSRSLFYSTLIRYNKLWFVLN